MEKMLEILDGAIQGISKLKGEVVKIIHDYNVEVELLKKMSSDLDADRKRILEREKAVSKIEDVVALEAEAKALKKKVIDFKTSLQKEKDDFTSYMVAERNKVTVLANQVIEDGKQIKAEYEAQKKERALLEEDKKTYKQKIAAGLINLADKR